jgi:hypothetical protein
VPELRRFYKFLFLACIYCVVSNSVLKAQENSGNNDQEEVQADTTSNDYSIKFSRAFRPVLGKRVTYPFLRPIPSLYFITLPHEEVKIRRRLDGGFYTEKRIAGQRSGAPSSMSFDEYSALHKHYSVEENWRQLIFESREREERQRGLLDFRIEIPGGRESAFTTIFGTPEVNLRVNGVAQMNVGASIQKSEDPSLPPDQQTRVDPTFDQSLQLNIQGNIGDKLTIQTDWDTERTFDYQNRLNIVYEGYDDEIIKSIEMGNVTMNTGNSLIRGSGALFGIKSVAELGSLRLTTVLSQQDGESNVETIRGGSQERISESGRPITATTGTFFWIFLPARCLKQAWPIPSSRAKPCKLLMWRFGCYAKIFRPRKVQGWPLHWPKKASTSSLMAVMALLTTGSIHSPINCSANFVILKRVCRHPISALKIPGILRRDILPFWKKVWIIPSIKLPGLFR